MIEANELVVEARKLIGVPWAHRGRTVNGVDCIGLLLLAARNAGLDLFKHCGICDRPYGPEADPALYALVVQFCTRIEAPVHGSLILMKFERDKHPRHFAIYTNATTVIHAEMKKRQQVIEHGLRAHWPKRVHSVWKVPGVHYEGERP